MIEEKILEILKKQRGFYLSIRDIVDLSNEDYQEVYDYLNSLEEAGRVLSKGDSYTLLNNDYLSGTVYTNSRGDKYIYNNSESKIFIEPYPGLKEYDLVILRLGVGNRRGQVEKIVKRGEECALFEVVELNGAKTLKAIGHDIQINFQEVPQLVDGDLVWPKKFVKYKDNNITDNSG